MSKKKYIVVAPFVVFKIKDGTSKKEYALKKGDTEDLPDDSNTVKALVSRKLIQEVVGQTTPQKK